ncbi:MAG: C39 family peptidase [Cellvibrionaceae bacterium]
MDKSIETPLTQSTPSKIDKEYQTLYSFYEKSQYRKAYDLGVKMYGAINSWPTPKLKLLAGRILSHLGLYRKADAIFFNLWRQHPNTEKLASYVINAYHQWHGPLAALEEINKIKDQSIYSKNEAYLLAEEASILMRYRDFKSADIYLNRIPENKRNPWIKLQRAELEQCQDNYEHALAITESIIANHPNHESIIRKKATLLDILGRSKEAIILLDNFCKTTESWWAEKQLFQLLLEARDYRKAKTVLEKLKSLSPIEGKETKYHHNAMEADLLCAQEKYDEALNFLEKKNFFHSTVKKSIEKSRKDSVRKVLDVPFTRQSNMTCGPASLASVSKFWGKPIDQQHIIDEICYGGTQAHDERLWVEKNGWYCCEFDLEFDTLKTLIDLGIPVLLSTVDPGSAHLQIIIGYDESMGTYLLRDPYHTRLQEFLAKECEEYYAASGPRCMIMAPSEMSGTIAKLKLPAVKLYDELYNLSIALEKNDREIAEKIVHKFKNKNTEHRLNIIFERKLAMYDNDESAILTTTEKLLTLFPNDVNYQISKASSLKELGSSTRTLDYLESISQTTKTHFLILSRLADELRWDQRQSERTEKLYHQLLRINPVHTTTLYGYAGTLWDKRDYLKSYQLYRFCACLDDTNENYANSFFKAARFHKETDQAISFLIDRFERFGKQSSAPAISLYNALDSIDRTHEALNYLDKALKVRPNDGDLLLFISKTWANIGRQQKAKDLLIKAKNHCQNVRFNETAVEIYEVTLDIAKALSCCEEVLAVEPMNFSANRNYARLLVEQGNREKAIKHIQTQLTQFPQNAFLQKLLIDWTDPHKPEDILSAYLDYSEAHPNDAWAKRGLSISYTDLGRYDEAIISAQAAIKIDNSDARNHGQLGDTYIATNQLSLANDAFKESLRCSCDYTYAFKKLLEVNIDRKSQKEAVIFIHNELMNQVSYGDGILEFEDTAYQCFDSQQISEFLTHALNVRPDLWQSWIALSTHLRESGQNREALNAIESAIEKFPLIPRLHYEKAKTLKVLHEDKKAIECLKYTLQLSPGWTWASNELCTLYEQAGDFTKALDLQEKAIQYNPLSSTPYGFIADLQEALGQQDKAIDALEKAIERNISYSWAWRKYFSLSVDKGTVLNKLKNYIGLWPENSSLLAIYSELTNKEADSIQLLEAYIKRRPHDVDMCIELIRNYVNIRDFKRAKHLVSDNYWNAKRPVAIIANEAWIYYYEDNYQRAIEIMQIISKENPNYYDAWRYLATWNTELKNIAETEIAVENCARLYPHDANVLCFCAEKLQNVGSKKDISVYLKHAFELDTTDQYNGLTYIDHLLETKKIEQAETACDTLLAHRKNPYVYLRCLQIAAKKEDTPQILSYFEKSLKEPDELNSISNYMWKEILKLNLTEKAAQIIKDLHKNNLLVDSNAGKCLGEFDTGNMPLRKFQSELLEKSSSTPFFYRYLEAYIRLLIEQKKLMPRKLEEKLLKLLKEDTLNWALNGYNKFLNGNNNDAALFMMGLESSKNIEPWMLYYFSMACRYSQHWDKGKEIIKQAHSLASDNFRNDIIIWSTFDKLTCSQEVDDSCLNHIQPSNLEPTSHYILASAKVLATLRGTDFVSTYKQLSPLLRECQRQIQHDPNNIIFKKVKKITRKKLHQSLPPMPPLKTLFWKWRLSNHF